MPVTNAPDPTRLVRRAEGAYGIVYRMIDGGKDNTSTKAMKVQDDVCPIEIEIMSELRHDNLCGLVGLRKLMQHRQPRLGLVMPFYTSTLNTARKSDVCGLRWLDQMVSALAYLHAHNILHLDIKPPNILITQDRSRAILCDFGLSLRSPYPHIFNTRHRVTPGFLPPEAGPRVNPGLPVLSYHLINEEDAKDGGIELEGNELLGYVYAPDVDYYSLGETFGQMFSNSNNNSLQAHIAGLRHPDPAQRRLTPPNSPVQVQATLCKVPPAPPGPPERHELPSHVDGWPLRSPQEGRIALGDTILDLGIAKFMNHAFSQSVDIPSAVLVVALSIIGRMSCERTLNRVTAACFLALKYALCEDIETNDFDVAWVRRDTEVDITKQINGLFMPLTGNPARVETVDDLVALHALMRDQPPPYACYTITDKLPLLEIPLRYVLRNKAAPSP
jgi:serine/threonine protein kinase